MKEHLNAEIVELKKADPQYPSGLRVYLGDHAPKSVAALGNFSILEGKILGLFCSLKCPGHLILRTHDLAQHLKQANLTVVGGFHSPIERECLRILLRGTQPIIICPARSLSRMRIRLEYKEAIEKGRLLLLSPFKENQRRNTVETAMDRNRFVAALADAVFVAHASPNSKMEKFCHEVLKLGKPLYTFESVANKFLINIGAKPLSASNLDSLISQGGLILLDLGKPMNPENGSSDRTQFLIEEWKTVIEAQIHFNGPKFLTAHNS